LFAPGSLAVPTAREVAPWVATIERLWDDPAFEARHRALAKAEAERWDGDRLAEQYERLFASLRTTPGRQGTGRKERVFSIITGTFLRCPLLWRTLTFQ